MEGLLNLLRHAAKIGSRATVEFDGEDAAMLLEHIDDLTARAMDAEDYITDLEE